MDGTMTSRLFDLQDVLRAFQRSKVLTKRELLKEIGCSTMTVWRLLHQHGYLTSYNDNARHYTLVDIPQFDEHGLWAYRNARFSKWGALTDTIVGLVEQSPSGLTAEELQGLLEVPNVKPLLTRLTQRESLTREKVGGRYVYFALPRNVRAKQQEQRKNETSRAVAAQNLPPLDHIIALLVEIIRRPRGTPRQWARRLKQHRVPIGTEDIEAVLAHYAIDAKKGLSDS
jgi:hypothetical protein